MRAQPEPLRRSTPLLCAHCLSRGARTILSYTDQLLCVRRRWGMGMRTTAAARRAAEGSAAAWQLGGRGGEG